MEEGADPIPLRKRGGPKLELIVTSRQVLFIGAFLVALPLFIGLPFAIEGIILTHENVSCDRSLLKPWLLASGIIDPSSMLSLCSCPRALLSSSVLSLCSIFIS